MEVLGGEVEGHPWRMLRMSENAAKMEKELRLALGNGGFMNMKSTIGVMEWKVARGDEGEG